MIESRGVKEGIMGNEMEKSVRNVVWLKGSSTDSSYRLSLSTASSPSNQMTYGPSPPFSPGKEVLATQQESMLTTEEWEMKVCLERWWLKVMVKPCLPTNLSMLEAKLCALRDCFPPEINVL